MNLPAGFLGTRADILMDLVVCSLLIILPLLVISWRWARGENYAAHRKLMLRLAITLAIVVTLFEIDIRMAGGFYELARGSSYENSPFLSISLWVHLPIAIITSIIWLSLIILSLKRFGNPPTPGDFSAKHRFFGRIGMVMMALTGITGVELYALLFVL